MKMYKQILSAAVGIFVLSGLAQADIRVTSHNHSLKAGGDPCGQFDGTWNGEGYISASLPWYLGGDLSCHYNQGSSGGVTVTDGSSSGSYNVHVDITKAAGSDMRCPGSETIDLPATCSNGTINVASDKAQLNGTMSSDSHSADLTGVLHFSVVGNDIAANVDKMHLEKR